MLKKSLALALGCILALLVLEIFLIFYNPFESSVKFNKIRLPANRTHVIKNISIKKLDRFILHTKNSLGFRGEEPPHEFHKYLTIVALGGSTTECKYLADGKTWVDVLLKHLTTDFRHLWINKGGLDGHSTFGHKILMESYILSLKPKIVLFLVGTNDIERSDLVSFELQNIRDKINLSTFEGV